jgi:hypothetical protein
MHELKHAEAGVAADDLHPPAEPAPARSHSDHGISDAIPAPPPGAKGPRARGRRRARWAGDAAMPAIEKKRLAARELRKAYGRIKSDFSEAYEHCRTDGQRRALELAHQAAKVANLRALDDRLLEDREVWRMLASGFRPERARAERHLSRLVTADALMRILKRLALIETLLGALSA